MPSSSDKACLWQWEVVAARLAVTAEPGSRREGGREREKEREKERNEREQRAGSG